MEQESLTPYWSFNLLALTLENLAPNIYLTLWHLYGGFSWDLFTHWCTTPGLGHYQERSSRNDLPLSRELGH